MAFRHDYPKAGQDHTQPGAGGHRLDVLGNGHKLGSYSLDAVLCVKANGPAKNVSALASMVWVARTGGLEKKPDGWQAQSSCRLFWDVDSPFWVAERKSARELRDPWKGRPPATIDEALARMQSGPLYPDDMVDAWIPPRVSERLFYRYADGSIGLSDYGEAVAESLAASRDLALWEVT